MKTKPDRAEIHLIIGEIERDTKTGCNQRLDEVGSGVPYANRKAVTCVTCQAKAARIAAMRKEAP